MVSRIERQTRVARRNRVVKQLNTLGIKVFAIESDRGDPGIRFDLMNKSVSAAFLVQIRSHWWFRWASTNNESPRPIELVKVEPEDSKVLLNVLGKALSIVCEKLANKDPNAAMEFARVFASVALASNDDQAKMSAMGWLESIATKKLHM